MTAPFKDTASAALIGAVIGYLAHSHWIQVESMLHWLVA